MPEQSKPQTETPTRTVSRRVPQELVDLLDMLVLQAHWRSEQQGIDAYDLLAKLQEKV